MQVEARKTILLVEDELITAMIGEKTIKSFGYEVVTANTGENAVDMALTNPAISLILMDVDLGKGINGPEAARQILKSVNVPIVFHTSHSEKEYVDSVKEITRYGYVIKNSGDFVLRSSIEMAYELFESNQKVVDELQERKKAETELMKKMEELQRFHKLTVGRELKMIELKKEVNDLRRRLGLVESYKIIE